MTELAEETVDVAAMVRTVAGPVRGGRAGDVLRFRGVPFAAPPTGELRLQPPSPPQPWSETRDALSFASPPRQRKIAEPDLVGSEDCLYLNVWTSGVAGAEKPVLLWFFGGGFEGGSTSEPRLDGAALARVGEVVVVTAAYRVGALGWLHLSDRGGPWERSSNLGLQDQLAALQWVAENIGAFGGDAGRVTVAGESAGAFSVGALLALPEARRLVSRAALFSGSADRVFPAGDAHDLADRLLHALGIPGRPEGLMELPVDSIVAAQSAVIDRDIGRRNGPGGRSWGVVHDGVVLREHPAESIAVGQAADVTVLLGSTEDEVRLFRNLIPGFAPTDLDAVRREMATRVPAERAAALVDEYVELIGSADPGAVRERLLTDAIYRLPSTGLADSAAAAGGTVFVYRFGCPYDDRFGCFHGSDVRFLFNNLAAADPFFPLDPDPALQGLAAEMSGWFTRFIQAGDPGWPAWQPVDRCAMRADIQSRIVPDPDGPARAIWARTGAAPFGTVR